MTCCKLKPSSFEMCLVWCINSESTLKQGYLDVSKKRGWTLIQATVHCKAQVSVNQMEVWHFSCQSWSLSEGKDARGSYFKKQAARPVHMLLWQGRFIGPVIICLCVRLCARVRACAARADVPFGNPEKTVCKCVTCFYFDSMVLTDW